MHYRTGLTLLLCLGLTQHAAAQSCPSQTVSQDRPRIGLALGGGGARGTAHIGVLKALEELQVPIDYIAGTSMGALIGAMYASGMNAEELEEGLGSMNWDLMFRDRSPRDFKTFRRKRDDDLDYIDPSLGYRDGRFILPEGALVGQNAELFFQRMTLEKTWNDSFDNLPIPFRAVAADIVTGDEVVLDSGSLARAMRASMSIPGLFAPVELNDRLLVDGGLANNLPVQVLHDMGADIVIAVDVSSPMLERDAINDVLDMIEQMSNLMVYNSTISQIRLMTDQDLLITPPLADEVTSGDFDKSIDAMRIGYQATLAQSERLGDLSLTSIAFDTHRQRVVTCLAGRPIINFIQISNQSAHSDDIILKYLDVWPGEPLEFADLEQSISEIYGLGGIREARYEIVRKDADQGLVLIIEPDRRLPNRLEYGLSFFSDGLDNAINVRAGLLRSGVDQSGSEWRIAAQLGEQPELFAEYFRPLDPVSQWFVNPNLDARRRTFREFRNNQPVAEFLVDTFSLDLVIGRYFGNHSELALGLSRGLGDVELVIGENQPELSFSTGSLFARYRHDTLDDVYFPTQGTSAMASYRIARDALGSDDDFEQFTLNYFTTTTLDKRHVLQLGLNYETTLNDNAPIYGLYRAGGFTRLSGLDFNAVAGQHYAQLLTGYRYQLGQSGLLPAFVGGTVELGNTFDDRSDINFRDSLFNASIYFGYRSPIGPVYAGFGFAEGGEESFFIRLGDFLVNDQ